MSDILGNILDSIDKGDAQRPQSRSLISRRLPQNMPRENKPTVNPKSREPFRIPKRTINGECDKSDSKIEVKRYSVNSLNTFQELDFIKTQSNLWAIDVSKMPVVEMLHVDVYLITKRGKTQQVTGQHAGVGDLAKQYRLWGLFDVWENVIKNNSNLFGHKPCYSFAYDCGSMVYVPEGVYKGGQQEEVVLNKEDFSSNEWSSIAKMSRVEVVKAVVDIQKINGKINPHDRDTIEKRSQIVRCLEVITSQITNSHEFFTFSNSFYLKTSDKTVLLNGKTVLDKNCQMDNEGKEIKTGFEKTLRFIQGPLNSKPLLAVSVDIRRSPFYQQMHVLKFVTKLYSVDMNERKNGKRRWDDDNTEDKNEVNHKEVLRVQDIIRRERPEKTENKLNELKALAVSPTHLSSERNLLFFVDGFMFTSAKETMIEVKTVDDNVIEEVSVYDYYLKQYKIRLKYPDLPLVIQKKGRSKAYWPMELLLIENGQRVKVKNISGNMHQEMTGKFSMLPEHHVARYKHVFNNILRVESNKYLKAFNVSLKMDAQIKITAQLLPAPIINFGCRKTYQPETGHGKKPIIMARNTRFFRPAEVTSLTVINFDNAMTAQEIRGFCRALEQSCKEQDIRFHRGHESWKIVDCVEVLYENLEKIMYDAKDRNDSCVIGITVDRKPDVHDVMKLFELRIGMQTYHLSKSTCLKVMSHGGRQTAENVVRKFNPKCGGLNFTISIPKTVNNRTVCLNEKSVQDKLLKNTMFVGFELSHGGALCLFDKQNNISSGEPSIVGVAYSIGHSAELGGFKYLQNPKEHSLMYLNKYFPQIIMNQYSKTKSFPNNIVIYRTTSGEGSYSKTEKEVDEIREALKNDEKILRKLKVPYKPNIVMIAVGKNSHFKVFPDPITGHKSFDQNVPSGTCIHSYGTGYSFDEFILISQSALIGTARPTRYTILANDAKWSKNEISHLTFFLSFGHQVSFQPPGIPDVLYAAENLAKRGRNDFKAHQKLKKLQRFVENGEEEKDWDGHMMQLSEQLNSCSLTAKNFWA